ncbi:MAG: gliding motility-associated C-terminal domain-containing protein [Bacteroidia bacterium]|nr:gliding motility-associated C-terminal domain-containing protein [Bacteroidia bacterium]
MKISFKNQIQQFFLSEKCRKRFLLVLILPFFLPLFNPLKSQGFPCDLTVPHIVVNLTGQPAGTFSIPQTFRQGSCCGLPTPLITCMVFEITLDPGAVGFSIHIDTGVVVDSFKVNCFFTLLEDSVYCAAGGGTYYATFCRSGVNPYAFTITSIPGMPALPPFDSVRVGCDLQLQGVSFDSTSIAWQSISPGPPGTWNHLLSDTSSWNPILIPDGSAPSNIDYQVCGVSPGGACTMVATYCDTISIHVYDSLQVAVFPGDTTFCAADSGIWLRTTVAGGDSNYTIVWRDGMGNVLGNNDSLFVTLPDSYSVTVSDGMSNSLCPAQTVSVKVAKSPLLSIPAVTQNPTCNGFSNGQIQLTPSGGLGNLALLWSNGPTTSSISGLPAGGYSVTVTDSVGCTLTDSFTLTEPGPLAISILATQVLCNGDSNGILEALISGGTPPYTLLWNTGAASALIDSLPAGTYILDVTDSLGCQLSDTTQLIDPLPLALSNLVQNVLCFGDSNGGIDLTPSGGILPYAFSWSSGDTTEDLTGLMAGPYSVELSDSNGCILLDSFYVPQSQVLSLSTALSQVACNGDSTGAIDLVVSGGVLPYTFSWSNGAITEDLNTLPAGLYSVLVTDSNGCMGASSWQITEPSALALSCMVMDVLCNGDSSGALDVSVSGGFAPYKFLWSNGAATEDLSGIPSGNYTLTLTDSAGCVRVDSFLISQAVTILLTAVTTPALCNGDTSGTLDLTVSGGQPPYTYQWSNGASTQDLTNLPPGMNVVMVTDSNGCVATDSFVVLANLSISLSYSLVPNLCAGDKMGSISVTPSGGTPPYNYNWSNGSTLSNPGGLTAGVYTLIVHDSVGCFHTETYTLTDPDSLLIQFQVADASCLTESDGSILGLISGGTPPLQYLWSDGQTNSLAVALAPGLYMIIVTDSNGCQDSAWAVVSTPLPPNIFAGADTQLCAGTLSLSGTPIPSGMSGLWTVSPSGPVFSAATAAATQLTSPVGQFEVVWTVSQGNCVWSDTLILISDSCPPADLVMPTGFTPNQDGSNDYFIIQGIENYPENEFQVISRWGNVVYSREGYLNEWDGRNNGGQPLPDGTYMVILKLNNGEQPLQDFVDLRR